MSEGKLKQDILKSHLYERWTTPNGNRRLGILENDLDNILNGVAKEFPTHGIGKSKELAEIDCLNKINNWFNKWFNVLSAGTLQVDGGCAGHMDLSKLENLEKE